MKKWWLLLSGILLLVAGCVSLSPSPPSKATNPVKPDSVWTAFELAPTDSVTSSEVAELQRLLQSALAGFTANQSLRNAVLLLDSCRLHDESGRRFTVTGTLWLYSEPVCHGKTEEAVPAEACGIARTLLCSDFWRGDVEGNLIVFFEDGSACRYALDGMQLLWQFQKRDIHWADQELLVGDFGRLTVIGPVTLSLCRNDAFSEPEKMQENL